MKQINLNLGAIGRLPIPVKTPIIRPGDDLTQIAIDSLVRAIGTFYEKSVICITEAVVAIAQSNFAKPEDIQSEILRLFPGETEITLLFPIQSRNRFMNIPKAIAAMPQIRKINVVLSYPCDEVGNRLISEETLLEKKVNRHEKSFTADEFYAVMGKPKHVFTGKDYIEEFQKACLGKGNVILCNDMSKIKCKKNVLICTIREDDRELQKRIMKQNGAENVFDLSDILCESVNGSGYSKYGLYGSNMMGDGVLKLMPRNCQEFVDRFQERILQEFGVNVEVMIYGDGCFKDSVGRIWELADPEPCLAATKGLAGTPKEVKAKYIASLHPDATPEELMEIINKAKEERMNTDDLTGDNSLGTTPRRITDLLASLADLATGSGDECTPIVCILGYLK